MGIDMKASKDILVFGVRRNGNHGVINFLLGLLDPKWAKDWHGARDHKIHVNGVQTRDVSEVDSPDQRTRFRILSWEDKPLEFVKQVKTVPGRETQKLIVLRDPFNWLASLIKRDSEHPEFKRKVKEGVQIWTDYAEEFFVRTADGYTAVNFTKWFQRERYRQLLAVSIGERFRDCGTYILGSIGSSFDQRSFRNRPQDMDVLGRWKHPDVKPRVFRWIRRYPRLIELSEHIFGFNPLEGAK